MGPLLRRRATLLVGLALLARCSASGNEGNATGGVGGTAGGGATGGAGGLFDGSPSDAPGDVPPWGARLVGTVWGPHPDGDAPLFPVSGAAIIANTEAPAAISDSVYCNECVELPANAYYTYSAADGSFALDVPTDTKLFLSVQKGSFRRSREITTPADIGVHDLDAALTTLPSKTVPGTGDTIPKIALAFGDYDHVEDVLAKVGIGTDDGAYGLQWGTEPGYFDVFDNAGPSEPGHGEPMQNLWASGRLDQYQVVIFACSYNANFVFMNDAATQQKIKDWVWKGGRLYVSDYAMPVAEMPWHDFAWFTDPLHGGCNENQFPPNCNHGPPFEAPATAADPKLAEWLDGMGELQGLVVKENWDTIGSIDKGEVGTDPQSGQPVLEEPKVWVEGPWAYPDKELTDVGKDPATWDKSPHPFTISWPYNCGRVLFTTYHTVGSTQGGRHPGLLPQEKILFYLLMEITVCQDGPIVK